MSGLGPEIPDSQQLPGYAEHILSSKILDWPDPINALK